MSNEAALLRPPPPKPPRVSPKTVERALSALLKWRDSNTRTHRSQPLDHDDFVYLIVTLKKIPQKGSANPEKIPLPHPLIDPVRDLPELCLIIDDRAKNRLTKDAAMGKIKSENIPINEVIKISKLKTDYRAFEAKRKLCDSYDMFFADRRVIPLLPRLLGKKFFEKKKIPVAIDLKHNNWKEQIEKACGSALFSMGTGTCSVIKVGKSYMGSKVIAENVMAVIDAVADIVPSKWKHIRSFHLKLLESLALPVYQSVPDLKLNIEASGNEDGEKLNDDATSQNQSGSMKKKKKGMIHEVQYMDSNTSEMLDDDAIGRSEDGANDEMGKKRKMV